MAHIAKEEEIKNMRISTIKTSKKTDSKIVYGTVKDQDTATLIFKRTSQKKNDEVHVTPYIPPQIFERYRSF